MVKLGITKIREKKMKSIQSALVAFLLTLFLSFNTAMADPTNFNYTQLGLGLGRLNIPDTCINGECYTGLGTARIEGSIQFADDWLVARLESAAANNTGSRSSIKENVGGLGLSLVHALGNQVDIQVGVDSLSSNVQICYAASSSNCASADDTGHDYYALVNAWIDGGRHVAVSGGIGSTSYSKSTSSSTSTQIGASYYPIPNHQFGFGYSNSTSNGSSTTEFDLDYFYHFNK
jgi:hypothetical protein